MLGQRRVDDQANEIPAVPDLLALLALDGWIVTTDAMHCQKDTAQAILARGGDYVLALEANQPALFDDVRLLLTTRRPRQTISPPPPMATTVSSRRGAPRSSMRSPGSPRPTRSPALEAIGKVTAARAQRGRITTATRYYLLSRPPA